MTERPQPFDPYHKWLGISPGERPPTYYRLLGIRDLEEDADVIAHAADRCMAHVRTFQNGPRGKWSQKLLGELSAARICLLNPERKRHYDESLRGKTPSPSAPPPPVADAAPELASSPDRAPTTAAPPAATVVAFEDQALQAPRKSRSSARRRGRKMIGRTVAAILLLMLLAVVVAVGWLMLRSRYGLTNSSSRTPATVSGPMTSAPSAAAANNARSASRLIVRGNPALNS